MENTKLLKRINELEYTVEFHLAEIAELNNKIKELDGEVESLKAVIELAGKIGVLIESLFKLQLCQYSVILAVKILCRP